MAQMTDRGDGRLKMFAETVESFALYEGDTYYIVCLIQKFDTPPSNTVALVIRQEPETITIEK